MFNMRSTRPDVPVRDAPGVGVRRGARWAMVLIACAGLSLEGCANGRFNCFRRDPCAPQRTGFLQRLFHRNRAPVMIESGCEPVLSDGCVPVDGGIPSAVVTPGPGPLLPAPASPPVIGDEPTNLAPAPLEATPKTTTPGGSASVKPPSEEGITGRAMYEARGERASGGPMTARRDAARGRMEREREPASRVAPAPATGGSGKASDPLSDLPGLSGPSEGTVPVEASSIRETGITPPVPPPAEERAGDFSARAEPAPITATVPVLSELPPSPPRATGSLAPGIARFKVVEPRLACGSLPVAAGWSWLAQTGYKTVLDLRDPGQVKAEDLAAIDHEGLRYVAMPLDASNLDGKRLARLYSQLEQESERPLYVFDADGGRPALLWYLHQVEQRAQDSVTAAREVEEISVLSADMLAQADAYLKARKAEMTGQAAAPGVPAGPEDTKVEPASGVKPGGNASPSAVKDVVDTLAEAGLGLPLVYDDDDAHELEQGPADGAAERGAGWKGMMAVVATGLGFPLAFMSGQKIHQGIQKRASLPAPARSARALPGKSGA